MTNKPLNHLLKRKKLIFLLGALGFTSYGAYKLYNSPSVIKNKDRVIKIFSALASITEFVGDSAETLGVISKDLKTFIQSDSDQIPCSLKQVFKITKSDEFSDSIIRVSRALTIGVSRGFQIEGVKGSSFSDKVLNKLFSPDGYGFVSVMVGSFSRNMVMAIYADRSGFASGDPDRKWVDVVTDDKFRKLVGDCIQQFVTTMVTVYLDKTIHINTYDEIISTLTDPKHEQEVRNLMLLICNGAVETFVRTSHHVLTNSKSNSESDSNASSYLIRSGSTSISKVFGQQELVLSKLTGGNVNGYNMRFVVDLTKRLTLATVKSFIGCLLSQLSMGIKTRFVEAYRHLNAKSMVVMTVWISVYLHMFSGPWSLISLA